MNHRLHIGMIPSALQLSGPHLSQWHLSQRRLSQRHLADGLLGVGNGGDLSEIEVISVGYKIGLFLESDSGKAAFPEIDPQSFKKWVGATLIKAFLFPNGTIKFNSPVYSPLGKGKKHLVIQTLFEGAYEAIRYSGNHEISVFFKKKLNSKKSRYFQLDIIYRGKTVPGMGLVEYADYNFKKLDPLRRVRHLKNTLPLRCVFIDNALPPKP